MRFLCDNNMIKLQSNITKSLQSKMFNVASFAWFLAVSTKKVLQSHGLGEERHHGDRGGCMQGR